MIAADIQVLDVILQQKHGILAWMNYMSYSGECFKKQQWQYTCKRQDILLGKQDMTAVLLLLMAEISDFFLWNSQVFMRW